MANMKDFTLWFIDKLPDFLLSEPICYLVGIVILGFIIKCILVICGLSERRYKS